MPHAIQTRSSEVSLHPPCGNDAHSDELCIRAIVLFLWMLSRGSTLPFHSLEQSERPGDKVIPRRLPAPLRESARTTERLLVQSGSSENGPRHPAMVEPNSRLLVDASAILIACRGLRIRGGPKLRRLGQSISRRSQRLSRALCHSHLARSPLGIADWSRALNIFINAVNGKQSGLSSQSLPNHVCSVGTFILKRLARDSAKDEVDRDQIDVFDLFTRAVNRYAAKYDYFYLSSANWSSSAHATLAVQRPIDEEGL